jgi:hypothetical protein
LPASVECSIADTGDTTAAPAAAIVAKNGILISTVSEFQWCHAEMIFHVFTKERGIGKGEFVANLLDTEICLTQVVTL